MTPNPSTVEDHHASATLPRTTAIIHLDHSPTPIVDHSPSASVANFYFSPGELEPSRTPEQDQVNHGGELKLNDLAVHDLPPAPSFSPVSPNELILPTQVTVESTPMSGAGEVQIPEIADQNGAGGDGSPDDPSTDENHKIPFSWRLLWAYTGPGWLMSIAYLDPGNLESDLQAGAYTGYQLIWVLFWSTCLGLVMQILAARLGVVSGKHLAQVCRENYGPVLSKLLWIMTELAIIGSDIQEVFGSAIAFKILFGLPLWAGVLITGADTFTFMLLHAFGIRKLEAFFAILIATMSACFWIDFGYIKPSISGMGRGLVPDVSDYAVIKAVSILGAIIMPHNIYLHSALVQSRNVDRSRPSKIREANYYFAIEGAVALGVSFFINLAVVSVFAKGFFSETCARDNQALVQLHDATYACDVIGLQEAGGALEFLLGSSASTIWAIGLLAAGQSSTMTGTFAGQFVMEGFLTLKIASWKRVAFTRSMALLPAGLVALVAEASSSHTVDTMDEYLNILQSIQLPFALLPVLHFTNSPRIMGQFANGPRFKIFGWVCITGIIAINFYLVGSEILDVNVSGLPDTWWMYLILAIIIACYLSLLIYIVWNDLTYAFNWIRKKTGYHPSGDRNTDGLAELYDQPDKGSPAWIAAQEKAIKLRTIELTRT